MVYFQQKCESQNPPKNYFEISKRHDHELWTAAYLKEENKLREKGRMSLVPTPKHVEPIKLLELFNYKFDNLSNEKIAKCRFVARGDLIEKKQEDIYAPVAATPVIRLFIAVAAMKNYALHQADVVNAFLNGSLKQPVYLQLPKRLRQKHPNCCWKTTSSIYGLPESPKRWHNEMDTFLKNQGFKPCPVQTCLYVYNRHNISLFLLLYVDDILYMGSDNQIVKEFEMKLKNRFEIKMKSVAESFVGLEIEYQKDAIVLHQVKQIKKLLETFEMKDSKETKTPMEHMLVIPETKQPLQNVKLFQSIVGGLLYVNIGSRPEISYAINQLSKKMKNPSKEDLNYAKRVLRYLAHNQKSNHKI